MLFSPPFAAPYFLSFPNLCWVPLDGATQQVQGALLETYIGAGLTFSDKRMTPYPQRRLQIRSPHTRFSKLLMAAIAVQALTAISKAVPCSETLLMKSPAGNLLGEDEFGNKYFEDQTSQYGELASCAASEYV